jgi:hypothetical protein
MSTDPIDDHPGAEAVPLRATDAGTEARTSEATGPAHADLSGGRPERKPFIPAHWRQRGGDRRGPARSGPEIARPQRHGKGPVWRSRRA